MNGPPRTAPGSRVTCGPCGVRTNEVVVMRQLSQRLFQCPECGHRERVQPKGQA